MLYFLIGALILCADQGTKFMISQKFEIGRTLPVIKDVFHITYVQNTGAAFSMFQGKRVLLLVLSIIIILALILYLIKTKPQSKMVRLSFALIISGAVGNSIFDRLRLGYVIDFLDFRLINFPVFNIADCAIVCGVALLFIHTIFLEGKIKSEGNG